MLFFYYKNGLPFSKIHDDLLLFICQNISSRSNKSLEKTLLIAFACLQLIVKKLILYD
jgi:hypothetical protein